MTRLLSGRRGRSGGRRAEKSAWSAKRGSGSSRRRRSCPRGRREGTTGGSGGGGGRHLSQREGRESESVLGPPFHLEIGGRTAENGLPSMRSPSQAL